MSAGPAGAVALMAFAVPMLAYSVWMLARLRRTRGWRRVPAVVLRAWLCEVDLGPSDGGPIPGWQPRVQFAYEVDGERRESSTYCVDPLAFRYASHRKALKQLGQTPAGRAIDAFVSPDGVAVLFTGVDWARKSHYLAVGVSGVLLVACSVALAVIL